MPVRPPHHAIGNGSGEQLGIIGGRDFDVVAGRARRNLLECGQDGGAIVARERSGVAVPATREGSGYRPVGRRKLAEPPRLGAQPFERRECGRETRDQRGGRIEIGVADQDARIAPVQRRAFFSEARERIGKSRRSRSRPRTAQDRPFERRDGAIVPTIAFAQPEQRMFEECKQGDRRQPAESCFRDQPREAPCRCVGERVAAGVVDRDVPTLECRDHPPRQRPIRRRQCGGLVGVLQGFPQRHRDRQRFLIGVCRFDHRDVGECSLDGVRAEPLAPAIRRGGWPQGFGEEPFATVSARRRKRRHHGAVDAQPLEQRLHGELRVAVRWRSQRLAAGIVAAD